MEILFFNIYILTSIAYICNLYCITYVSGKEPLIVKEVPQISDAEWQVMQVIWRSAPITANEVIEQLENNSDWKPKTIKTLIGRLVEKKVLGFHKEGKSYQYYPIVSEDEGIRVESENFLKKVFNGSLNLMLANFIEEQRLSEEDIKELKRIIDDRK
jgi:BlaI family transcriptional regulator, penicillinase repressor